MKSKEEIKRNNDAFISALQKMINGEDFMEDLVKALKEDPKKGHDLDLLKAIARLLNEELGLEPPINIEPYNHDYYYKYLKEKIIYVLTKIL